MAAHESPRTTKLYDRTSERSPSMRSSGSRFEYDRSAARRKADRPRPGVSRQVAALKRRLARPSYSKRLTKVAPYRNRPTTNKTVRALSGLFVGALHHFRESWRPWKPDICGHARSDGRLDVDDVVENSPPSPPPPLDGLMTKLALWGRPPAAHVKGLSSLRQCDRGLPFTTQPAGASAARSATRCSMS